MTKLEEIATKVDYFYVCYNSQSEKAWACAGKKSKDINWQTKNTFEGDSLEEVINKLYDFTTTPRR